MSLSKIYLRRVSQLDFARGSRLPRSWLLTIQDGIEGEISGQLEHPERAFHRLRVANRAAQST